MSAAQLTDLGVTRAQLRTLIDAQVVAPILPRVYGMVGAPETLERRQQAALLCLGVDAVLSHDSAARLHGFDRTPPDVVELTVTRSGRGVRAPVRLHTARVLPLLDRVRVAGWPCTSATRTIIDLARARVSDRRLEAAIDTAVRLGLSSPVVIVDRLRALRGPGHWGAPRLDHMLVDAGGHTMLERRFLELVRHGGLPRPTTQVVHRRDGRTVARVDFCFEAYGLVVEVSGRRGHSSPGDRARDAQRRNELQTVGRRVYEFTFEQVTQRRPWVLATVESCLRRAGWPG